MLQFLDMIARRMTGKMLCAVFLFDLMGWVIAFVIGYNMSQGR